MIGSSLTITQGTYLFQVNGPLEKWAASGHNNLSEGLSMAKFFICQRMQGVPRGRWPYSLLQLTLIGYTMD